MQLLRTGFPQPGEGWKCLYILNTYISLYAFLCRPPPLKTDTLFIRIGRLQGWGGPYDPHHRSLGYAPALTYFP